MEKNIFRFSIFLEKKDNGKHRRYTILTIIFLKLFLNFNLHLLKIPRSIVHRGEDVVSSLVKRTRGKEERFKDSQGSNEGTISLEELASIRIVKVSRARLYRALDQHCKDLQFQLHPQQWLPSEFTDKGWGFFESFPRTWNVCSVFFHRSRHPPFRTCT